MENILVNRYQVQQQLGKKAGRQTLLAKDLNTEQLVIVKLLSFSSDFQWDDLKLFEREAETLKSLSHPCIPRYLDYFEINSPEFKGFALIQTYIPAKTLEQYLQIGRKFTESEVKQIAKDILNILVYLHSLNPPVIHRDIKPSNILLGDRTGNNFGEVYLIDFGSVQTVLATEGTGTRTIVGTYGYMPQEQFGGRTVPASDLYSLGATLIYLVTGSHPADLPEKDFRIQFEEITNLSPNFTNWLKLMIEPSLGKRLRFANEAIIALDQPKSLTPSNTHLTFKKPTDSKIQLTKNQDLIEIIIPPVGLKVSTLTWFSSSIILAFINWAYLALWIQYSVINPFILTILLIFLTAGFISIYKLLFRLFGRIKLVINQHQITLIRELFGTKIKVPKPATKEDICLIQRIRKPVYKDLRVSTLEIKAQIIIWAGKRKKFIIGNDNDLISEPELDWLVHELSEWLDIPIRTE
ncbi:serine/threonine protein kinase [Anabaena cylindrica FACHB-243]|uniref:Serine/threonine protein kinase n=1 Tax=Anabaena cylindrica (strain ATCC 27899 / PCC 7122) TaxID=272123 RepID=K9ZIC1_ANACC|nr:MULTISPECIES: serine/threonine-protein kinase [Anabaena]AFZ58090.1 serine/threonine protein kinase [Anabaena cylindrica PCC 7122]MBD2419135.1 serine/threonine protein kinase [Anabaena cylindrica FACHB-243]MBY5284044.1 serine/threonine protein kinase [Anabaena sp. CCAP 1446/1C]MBY5306819.1 serine/threonine protein kinase [Anabaena sp. CCAP 1446/1C]MCM2409605.1 serine/threonine protein kinase [Anabaena sp. CCAP 1446/1C]